MKIIKIKRVYDKLERDDGIRILVDRLWPRGISKEKAKIDIWMKDIAPSHNLRKWFAHKEERWEKFKRRYFEELKGKDKLLKELISPSENETVTLLFSAKDRERNNAIPLIEYLEKND